ncbi:MAG: 50S ribosomal protein L10 [Candidatus Omnitrophota bacterium]
MITIGKMFRDNLIKQVKEGVSNHENVFLLSYSRVSSNKMSILRKDLKKVGAKIYSTRNTITQLAFKELKRDQLAERVEGQTIIVWSNSDAVEISKILVKFAKDFESVKIGGGLLKDRVLEKEDVGSLAELPSREVLLSTLLSTILAPVTRLAGALNAKSRDLLSILKQLSEKKGGS